jgi:hypothetical protein
MSVRLPRGRWELSLYPEAGEAGGSFKSAARGPVEWVPPGAAKDPERSRAEAARRAGAKVRRYCAANDLDRMITLTYRRPFCTEPQQIRDDVHQFVKDLRRELGGEPFPYVWVPELHKKGHKFHAHIAVGTYIPVRLIRDVWGRGHVGIDINSHIPSTATPWQRSRIASRYLSKYVRKSFELGGAFRPLGKHRYEIGQGFLPRVVQHSADTLDECIDFALTQMGPHLDYQWFSVLDETFTGPPSLFLSWER